MTRTRWQTGLLCAAMLAVFGSAGTTAQDQAAARAAAIQRSYDIQNIVARIEADKAAAVDEFLSSWQTNLDPTMYDVSRELRDVAMKAPAWQLYGAALVGDFDMAVRILRGRASAGKYINGLSAPEPKQAKGFGLDRTNLLGSTSADLVFTPVASCRMVDTRGSGALTGVLAANAQRTFHLEDDGFAAGQGGDLVCAGIPTISPTAWAVNITVTGSYSVAGGLKAWNFGAAEPSTSVINNTPSSAGGIANGLTLRGCNSCAGGDIIVKAFGNSTHVIIDVIGYYDAAPVSNAAVTRLAGTTNASVGTTEATLLSPSCPAGTTLIGGEVDDTGTVGILADFFQSGTTWVAAVRTSAGTMSATAYARCQDTPLQQ